MDEAMLMQRCQELGEAISDDYNGKTPLLIGVLNGAMVFMADLLRCISIPVEIDSISVSSYGQSATSGELKFCKDVSCEVKGRHVVFVEDIVDTGKTLKAVCELFAARGAASMSICTLLDKKARRAVEGLDIRYIGFDCPNEFIVGYGIDYAERYRNLPYVAALKSSVEAGNCVDEGKQRNTAEGEIVAPEAEEVPFSRMVNREMHRAGSCRPCLYFTRKENGCWKGDTCDHCHLCTLEEMKKRRNRLNLLHRKQRKQRSSNAEDIEEDVPKEEQLLNVSAQVPSAGSALHSAKVSSSGGESQISKEFPEM
eukprot:symbB.v1.2.004724.t1/scaffold219.1/size262806/4